MNDFNHRPSRLIVVLFALSGFSSLIYEIIWVRMLTMFVGGSAFSVSIVLTVFMAGLALGSAIAARYVDKIQRPESLVLAYGLLELVIGAYGLLFPLLISCCKPLYALIYRNLFQSLLGYNAVSSLISIALLILPTTLMGATLPFLCRYYIRALPHVGTRTGRLYGINTIGAAVGALICGFWMIRLLGVQGTLYVAVGINALIGVICIVLFGGRTAWRSLLNDLRVKLSRLPQPAPQLQDPGILAVIAVSGFCSMSYQVIWTKLLALLVGPTTYSFTIVLFTFITGLALGSIIFGWFSDKARCPFSLLIGTQLAAALFVLLVSHLLGNSQLFFAKLLFEFKNSPLLVEVAKAVCLFFFMLGPTVFLGAAFPVSNRICTKNMESVGASTGKLYAINTTGALLGSFCTGFFLVPLLGKALSISLLTGLQVLTCCLAGLSIVQRRSRRMAVVVCSGTLLIACFLLPSWDRASLAQAKYHRFSQINNALEGTSLLSTLGKTYQELSGEPVEDEIMYLDDGIGGFVAVGKTIDSLGITNIFLSISGKADASSHADQDTQVLLGQLPMLFHTNALKAMVVGLASGITAGEILHYPVERVDVLEISPEVVKACEYFTPWNNSVLTDPRVRIIMQDAKTHLTLSDKMYDIITSEPSNPWMAGVAHLFSLEFFEKVREHLYPGGIFVQWIHSYQMDWNSFSMVGRTALRVFPNAILVKTATIGTDYLIVCFKDEDAIFDLSIAESNLQHASKSGNMRMTTPKVLYPLIVSENLNTLFGEGPIHNDNRPLLEYLAPFQMFHASADITDRILAQGEVSEETKSILAEFSLVDNRLALAEYMASVNVLPFGLVNAPNATQPQKDRYKRIVEQFCRSNMISDYRKITDLKDRMLCLAIHQQQIREQISRLSTGTLSKDRLGKAYYDLGNAYVAGGAFEQAMHCFQQSVNLIPDFLKASFNLGVSYEQTGHYSKATEIFSDIVSKYPQSPRFLSMLAANHLRLKRQDLALSFFEKALRINRDYVPALVAMGASLGTNGDFKRAFEYSRRAIEMNPDSIKAYQNAAIALAKTAKYTEALHYVEKGLRMDPQNEVLLSLRLTLTRE